MKKTKNIIFLTCFVVAIICIIIFVSNIDDENRGSSSTPKYDVTSFELLDYNSLYNQYNSNNKSIIYISNSRSNYDAKFTEYLNKLHDNLGLVIYVVDITKADDEFTSFLDTIASSALKSYLKDNPEYKASSLSGVTPLLLITKSGEVEKTLIGLNDYKVIEEWIKSNY